ncbi:MAG: FkbM family methyltransferase [Planctomycetes bacterium]|nr:FkbM family methyltransferase [Planctomycetota bacterium]
MPPSHVPCSCRAMQPDSPWARLRAGVSRFGVWRTARGALALATLQVRRPARAAVALDGDDLQVGFDFPSQCPSGLVLYRELLEPDYELVRRVVGERTVVFDVGGGIGTYAMVAARRAERPVHLFEPLADNVRTVCDNLARNDLSARVRVNACVVTDRCGSADLRREQNAFVTRVAEVYDDPDRGAVRAVTLDAYCAEHDVERIDVLKIDVEGHEGRVLAGAERLLKEGRIGIVIVEMGLAFDECRAALERSGFRTFHYLDSANALVPLCAEPGHDRVSRPTAFHCNIVAVAPDLELPSMLG